MADSDLDLYLDWESCDRARLARDPVYDGRFFTAVRTTRIYCRPICPVRPALSKNVTFFPTAAAAERAGYRPCLRCRPETTPGSPAWRGSETTVTRGLRLIEEGFLDGAGVEALAERLGVGPRHLSRLFLRFAGASPKEIAATRRVQAAKRLIDATGLPLAEIAFAAGFGSIRRFNDAFRRTYGRPPSSFRRGRQPTINDHKRRDEDGTAAGHRPQNRQAGADGRAAQRSCDPGQRP